MADISFFPHWQTHQQPSFRQSRRNSGPTRRDHAPPVLTPANGGTLAKADDNLPAVDQFLLDKACAVADASRKEPDPVKRLLLEQTAMDLWQQAHAAQRAARYARAERLKTVDRVVAELKAKGESAFDWRAPR